MTATTDNETLRPTVKAGRLVMLEGSSAGQKFRLGAHTTLGRGGDCDIVVDDREVSRTHCTVVQCPDGSYLVEDLGSRNGTFINGERVKRGPLAYGDTIRLGPNTMVVFSPYDAAEEQVLQRQRLETLGRLTAGVAHDLNNMLGAILASCSYVMELSPEERAGEEGLDCMQDVESAATRAATLSRRLLGFTRSQPQHGLVNLTEVCREAAKIAQRTFEASVTVDLDLRPKMYVTGDSAQLLQVVLNLLVNARDAIQETEGSHITLRLARRSERRGSFTAVLTVEDDGPGIPENVLPHIFDPFFTTKDVRTGTGVGLATVREIVGNHAGSVVAEDRPEGGARFRVELPALRRASPRAPITATVARKGRFSGTVALIEDEALYRRGLVRLLSNMGLVISTAMDGPRGLDLLMSAPSWDLAVVDIDLPGINGIEVVRRARARGYTGPVLFISGHRDLLPTAQLRRLDASFMSKPIGLHDLTDKLHEMLRPPVNKKVSKTLG